MPHNSISGPDQYRFDIGTLSNVPIAETLGTIASPQRLLFTSSYLLVPSSVTGGAVYRIDLGIL
jgi:hypothetical protein